MEPADKPQEGGIVPEGGELHPVLLLFAPFGDDRESISAIRRFHSLRSFHQRLFTFAPFGDGRMLHRNFSKGYQLDDMGKGLVD